MPTYHVTWTAVVKGVTRVDADNAEEAEQALCHDGDPPLDDECQITDVAVQHVEEAEPGVTWN